ncbi:hypothetical protein GGR57DRAFT_154322 [Xylariaceae sp. FL1272]|nr:hypothetical protein GGR57DRAFT_154322 [Xylariaceae sp. FL1272]
MAKNDAAAADLRRQRLLMDIKELVTKPYPRIQLHPCDGDLTTACLVLSPEHYPDLHLSVKFPDEYPIHAPRVSMNSWIKHPNVFGEYICAGILKPTDEYTSAYTLKGIAIQLLSFFDSESVEQDYGDYKVKLAEYQDDTQRYVKDRYQCRKCGFGRHSQPRRQPAPPDSFNALVDNNPEQWPAIGSLAISSRLPSIGDGGMSNSIQPTTKSKSEVFYMGHLPNELVLLILEKLDDFEDLATFARAWPRVSHLVRDFDVIRQRELQCFCLKEGYQTTALGVGVKVSRGDISSEFDLISRKAFFDLHIRASINNISFQLWLPLPISRRHWSRVTGEAHDILSQMRVTMNIKDRFNEQVLYTFMNNIVVRLNQTAEQQSIHNPAYLTAYSDAPKSNLRHASEKAIDSYFHLFHILVCLATEDAEIVKRANNLLQSFIAGNRSKADCPNLGHLLIALLISDVAVDEALVKAIITEAITRNVVWLLSKRGANMAELSYLERDEVSAYRLKKTFEGSRTSYRLLMFSELFRRTARPSHEKPLKQVRDELFDRHGAPPRDAAGVLAAEVRRLHNIGNFADFMREMGVVNLPDGKKFTGVLRGTVNLSMERGYSAWAMSQVKAMHLRYGKDPAVRLTKEELAGIKIVNNFQGLSFFPNDNRGTNGGRGGRGGHDGAGRGGYYGSGHGRGRGRGGRGY